MVVTRAAGNELRFFVEPLEDVAKAPEVADLATLRIPPGVSQLNGARTDATLRPGLAADDSIRFEPVLIERKLQLLMSAPSRRWVRVNGRPAAALQVLEVGDQVQLDEVVLHLTLFLRPVPAPPPEYLVGVRCPVCEVAVLQEATVLVHHCGVPLHLDPESVPARDRLECARLGSCPACWKSIELEDGYLFVPVL